MTARTAIPNERWLRVCNSLGLCSLIGACLAILPPSLSFAADKVVDSRLEGTWKIVRVEGDEFWKEEPRTVHLLFKGQTLTFKEDESDEPLEIQVRTDSRNRPAYIDWAFTLEGEREKEKVSLPGIYAIDEDSLKICFARQELFALCRIIDNDGRYGPRPASFKDEDTICLFAERVKLKEKK